jgi:hypothetical protein
MNALSWIETHFRKAIDMESESESTCSHVRPNDVASVVQYFKDHIGSTWDVLTSSKAPELGGSANDLPREQIRKFHEGIGGRLGKACFSRNISRKMALFLAERNAAKNGTFFREAKNGEKMYFSRCEMRRKMVQFWAVSSEQ